jgi:peptidoglycan hydrolase-like protein with peptidoglycan-binding domain
MNNKLRGLVFSITGIIFFVPTLAFASFDQNLSFGARGSAVIELQQFLIAQNLLSADSATGYFGTLTLAAVKRFQLNHGITPQSGFFGPITRGQAAVLNVGINSKPQSITTIEDVNGFYGYDPAGSGKAGWIACSPPVQANVTRTIYPGGVEAYPVGAGGPAIEPIDQAQVKANCVLQSEGLPLENDGKITVLQKPEVQALIAKYNDTNIHLRALKFDYIQDKGFMERLLPIYKGRDIGCIIVLETPGESKVYVEDEKLQTFEELDYAAFQNYLNQASPADKQLFLDNLH